MIPAISRPSAKIYQFPTRAALAARSLRERTSATADAATPHIAPVIFGANWYHDAAIEEARGAGERG